MVALTKKRLTVQDYLTLERVYNVKYEFTHGEIVMMAGASERHNTIVTNLIANLHAQLRKSECRVYPSDLRVSTGLAEAYYYPDVSLVCGSPEIVRVEQDTLLNPIVVIEVLSRSTEQRDRGVKFEHYRTIDSLQEYILVAQDRAFIEHYVRQPDNRWLLSDVHGMDAQLTLSSVNAALTLADIYERVDFERSEVDPDTTVEG